MTKSLVDTGLVYRVPVGNFTKAASELARVDVFTIQLAACKKAAKKVESGTI